MYKLYKFVSFLIFSIIFIYNPVYSQDTEVSREQLQNLTNLSRTLITKSATETIGSPYLSDDFIKGHIMLNENSRSETTGLRYNMETNQVEFLRDGEVFITEAKDIYGFKLYAEDARITFRNGYKTNTKGIDSNTLLRTVYKGDVKLLVHYKATLHEDIATYATATKKNKYNISKNYYLVTEDGEFHKIENPKSDILGILDKQKHKLEDFVNKNDLDLNYENDIIRLLKYYENGSSS